MGYTVPMACGCGYRKRLREDREVRRVQKTHYLDNCATTMPDPRTLGAFERACRSDWANPSSPHAAGLAASERLEGYRETIGRTFACGSAGIAFCSSGSEALHAGLWGLALRYPSLRFVATPLEHAAVRAPLRLLRAQGREVRECPVDGDGRIVLRELAALLSDERGATSPDRGSPGTAPQAVLVYSPVNHETGNVQDAAAIRKAATAAGVLVFLDAVQTAPRLPAASWAPFCDLFAVSAHKLHAPKGSALLWTSPALRLHAFRFGGSQEGGLFPGTENVPGIAAFAEAARLLPGALAEEGVRLAALEKDFYDLCGKRDIFLERESAADHAPGVFCVSFPWIADMEAFMTGLARRGICASRFSACSDRVDGASAALRAMGRPESRSRTSLRIGLGRFSAREDLAALASALADARADVRRELSPKPGRAP